MSTNIRIEDELKACVAAAAQQMGKSAHAFIVDAVAERVERVERDAAFHTLADERWVNIRATGKTVSWSDAKAYLIAHAAGAAKARTHHTRGRQLFKRVAAICH